MQPAATTSRRFTSDSFAALCLRVAAVLLQFLATMTLTRRLGADDFGLFSLGFTLVMVASTVARFGVDKAAMRAIARRHAVAGAAGVGSIHLSAMLLVLIASGTIAALMVGASRPLAGGVFHEPALGTVLQIMGCAVVPFSLLFVVSEGFIGIQRVRSGLLIEVLPHLLFCLLLFSVVRPNLVSVCAAFLLACVLSLLVAYAVWCRGLTGGGERNGLQWLSLVEAGWPIGLVAVLMMALSWLDILIVGLLEDSASVGIYYTVSRIGRLLALVSFAISPVLAARVAALSGQGDLAAIARVFRCSLALVLAMNLPLLALILAVPQSLLALFGEPFVAGATALRFYALGQFGGALLFPAGALLVMTGHERLWRDVIAVAALFYVMVVFLLTARYGLEGTAAGTALGLLGGAGLAVACVHRSIGLRTLVARSGTQESAS
jgi:O-antigen/teichoic acid export membrane protein